MKIIRAQNDDRKKDEPLSKFWHKYRKEVYARFSQVSKESMMDGDIYSIFFEEIAILIDIMEEHYRKKFLPLFYLCIFSLLLSSISLFIFISIYLFHF